MADDHQHDDDRHDDHQQQQNDPDKGLPDKSEVEGAQEDIASGSGSQETNPDTPHFHSPPNTDLGQDQVQEKMNEATEQGFIGAAVDPTPNENYSLQTPQDAPTPETDEDASRAARESSFGNHLGNVETASHLNRKADVDTDAA